MNIREEQTFALFAFHLVRETLYLTLSPSHFYQLSFQGVSRAYSFQSIFFKSRLYPISISQRKYKVCYSPTGLRIVRKKKRKTGEASTHPSLTCFKLDYQGLSIAPASRDSQERAQKEEQVTHTVFRKRATYDSTEIQQKSTTSEAWQKV